MAQEAVLVLNGGGGVAGEDDDPGMGLLDLGEGRAWREREERERRWVRWGCAVDVLERREMEEEEQRFELLVCRWT